ncbi:MFS transporter [Beijerinckia indica]|uniref:Major facilitator superfamily MFS_1 n=1 Tax=Beijerinckia indica subsp. indica (strain ATCC 9039 / DSM 1715 / NCIMB 8712) TaxID=395963 RepID=B2IHI1_BEII9|nr:MFS transporter [Beijerinckia indica]ACB94502.1 major facilitator superfamily MFS_1 [Beijerinckia indica subsp. indica ATCC 9039]
MIFGLLRQRRFAPLFWCQFFSAFNDNFVRNMLAMLVLFRLGAAEAGPLVTLAVAIFILPSLVLSGLGGELADAHDKATVTKYLKVAELGVQAMAAIGFWYGSLPLLFAALFGLGTIAALFGPIKYGILPDLLSLEELTAGNALIEAATFLAILLGLTFGGFAAAHGRDPETIALQLLAIATACFVTSLFIPSTGAADPHLTIHRNPFVSTRALLVVLRASPKLWLGGLAISWFWVNAAVAVSLVPTIIRHKLGGGLDVETAITALFALGIGLGSIFAALLAHGRPPLRFVAPAAFGMAIFLIDLGFATLSLPATEETINLVDFLGQGLGLRLAFDVIALALSGGLFVVPLFAMIQANAEKALRARAIGGVNVVTALMIIGATLSASLLQSPLIGLSASLVLILFGVATLGVGGVMAARLRRRRAEQASLENSDGPIESRPIL